MKPKSQIKGRPAREEQTRAEILAATERLVQKHGLRKVTMEDIAAALGKKKSFLYYYFPGKLEVFQAMVENHFATQRQATRQAVAGQKEAREKIKMYVSTRLENGIKIAAAYGEEFMSDMLNSRDIGLDFQNLVALRLSFDREEKRFLAEVIKQGIKEGAFRSFPNREIDDLTYLLYSSIRGLEMELFFSREIFPDLVPRIAMATGIFLEGLEK